MPCATREQVQIGASHQLLAASRPGDGPPRPKIPRAMRSTGSPGGHVPGVRGCRVRRGRRARGPYSRASTDFSAIMSYAILRMSARGASVACAAEHGSPTATPGMGGRSPVRDRGGAIKEPNGTPACPKPATKADGARDTAGSTRRLDARTVSVRRRARPSPSAACPCPPERVSRTRMRRAPSRPPRLRTPPTPAPNDCARRNRERSGVYAQPSAKKVILIIGETARSPVFAKLCKAREFW